MSGTVTDEAGARLAPGTYFVLRVGDRYSYAALWAYAQAMTTAIEIGHLTDDEREELTQKCAEVESLAATWQATGR